MSRAASYLAVGAVAILVGGFAFWLVWGANNCGASRSVSDQQDIKEVPSMVPREFTVEGMACQGCADTITSVLIRIPGVQSARVSFEDKRAVVSADASQVPTEKIVAAIAAAGYKGKPTTAPSP